MIRNVAGAGFHSCTPNRPEFFPAGSGKDFREIGEAELSYQRSKGAFLPPRTGLRGPASDQRTISLVLTKTSPTDGSGSEDMPRGRVVTPGRPARESVRESKGAFSSSLSKTGFFA